MVVDSTTKDMVDKHVQSMMKTGEWKSHDYLNYENDVSYWYDAVGCEQECSNCKGWVQYCMSQFLLAGGLENNFGNCGETEMEAYFSAHVKREKFCFLFVEELPSNDLESYFSLINIFLSV